MPHDATEHANEDYIVDAPDASPYEPVNTTIFGAAPHTALFKESAGLARFGYKRQIRAGSGMTIVTLLHGTLTSEEMAALGAFRLQQYVLAGLYDRYIVARMGVEVDPALDNLAPHDVHVVVGDAQGHILCYMCMQSALDDLSSDQWYSNPHTTAALLMSDSNRVLFPCESEYGRDIYRKHPAIGRIPVTRVRELTRLVRNQALKTPLDGLCVVEAILAMIDVLCNPIHQVEAIVGCNGPEVRRLLHGLHIPVAYAPHAQIIGENRNGGRPGEELLWSQQSHIPGRFTPMAISIADLRDAMLYFRELDQSLGAPLPLVARLVAAKRRAYRGQMAPSRFALSGEALEAGLLWTADGI